MRADPGKGLIIVGTVPQCGKTAVCAGMAGALLENGFKVQALKPVSFTGASQTAHPMGHSAYNHDQVFLDKATRALQPSETIETESPHTLSTLLWNRFIENCRKHPYPTLVESVGTVATPLRYQSDAYHGQTVMDAVDLARLLEMPLLLVTPKSADLIGQLAPAFAYLWHRDASLLGWVAVGTQPQSAELPDWDAQMLMVSRDYQVPCLGEIPYSPSINIPQLQQGNLIRMAESGLDLFPIQQRLQLSLA